MAEFLNKNIKYIRGIKGISQQELADKVNLDRSTISRIENNEIETTLENAIKIAQALDISLYSLVGRDLVGKDWESIQRHYEEYKRILKEKGLIDDDDNINEENFNKLLQIADIMKDYNSDS